MLVEWGDLSYNNNNITFEYLDIELLFILSLISMILLRITFAISMYDISEWYLPSLIVFIFPEILIFVSVYFSHTENMEKLGVKSQNNNNNQPNLNQNNQNNQKNDKNIEIEMTNVQSQLQLLETTLESMPQVLYFGFCIFYILYVVFCILFFLFLFLLL